MGGGLFFPLVKIMIAHGCSFPLKGKSRQLLMRRGRDRGGSEHPQGWCSSSTRKVLGCSPGVCSPPLNLGHGRSGGMGGAAAWPICLATPSSLLQPLLTERFLTGYPLGPIPEHPAECQAGRLNWRLHLFFPILIACFLDSRSGSKSL